MARVLSALVLLPLVFGTVWFLPPMATLVLAEAVLILAFLEYAALALSLGARFSTGVPLVGAAATVAAVPYGATAVVLMAAGLTIATTAAGEDEGEHADE